MLTGLEEETVTRPRYSAQEHVALAAYHRDQQVIDKALGVAGTGNVNGAAGSSDDGQVKALRSEVERLKNVKNELKRAKSGPGGGGGGDGGPKGKGKGEKDE